MHTYAGSLCTWPRSRRRRWWGSHRRVVRFHITDVWAVKKGRRHTSLMSSAQNYSLIRQKINPSDPDSALSIVKGSFCQSQELCLDASFVSCSPRQVSTGAKGSHSQMTFQDRSLHSDFQCACPPRPSVHSGSQSQGRHATE